jgi:hypothetical protein
LYRGKRITIYSIASINYLIGTKTERRKKRDNDVAHALKCMKEGNGACCSSVEWRRGGHGDRCGEALLSCLFMYMP